jgi:hypothetical protein
MMALPEPYSCINNMVKGSKKQHLQHPRLLQRQGEDSGKTAMSKPQNIEYRISNVEGWNRFVQLFLNTIIDGAPRVNPWSLYSTRLRVLTSSVLRGGYAAVIRLKLRGDITP